MRKITDYYMGKNRERELREEYLENEELIFDILTIHGIEYYNEDQWREALNGIGEVLGIRELVFSSSFAQGTFLGELREDPEFGSDHSVFFHRKPIKRIYSLPKKAVIMAVERESGRVKQMSQIKVEDLHRIVDSSRYKRKYSTHILN